MIATVIDHIFSSSAPSRVVDVGSGTGGNVAIFAGKRCYVGIEPSRDAIMLSCRRFPDERFICASPWDKNAEEVISQANLVLLTDVLEHIEDDRGFLSRIVSLLSPDAVLLITVPAERALWSEHDISLGHYRRYEWEEFSKWMIGLSMKIHLLSTFNTRLYWPIRILRTWRFYRGASCGKGGTDLVMPPWRLNEWL